MIPQTPRSVRIVAWLLLISGGWDLLSLIVTARDKNLGFLLVNIPLAIVNVGLAWALRRHRWAYAPGLLLLLTLEGWAFWFFFVTIADRFSLAVRLGDGLLFMALASIPIVLLLTPSARKWAWNAHVRDLPPGESS